MRDQCNTLKPGTSSLNQDKFWVHDFNSENETHFGRISSKFFLPKINGAMVDGSGTHSLQRTKLCVHSPSDIFPEWMLAREDFKNMEALIKERRLIQASSNNQLIFKQIFR